VDLACRGFGGRSVVILLDPNALGLSKVLLRLHPRQEKKKTKTASDASDLIVQESNQLERLLCSPATGFQVHATARYLFNPFI
jgi:hypothetical protein